ncbi:hypothetical protein ACIOC2_20180 [Streptomyces sp. NPDC088337]|uniref:hypothetical protein n=1 Tax=unclassified Streptomyces TaxID=2593676 RepID=UPI00381A0661
MRPAKAWFVFSDDLPDGETVIPIQTPYGTALAVRPTEMTPQLLQDLNKVAKFLIDTGLWQPGDEGPGKPEEE